MTEQFIRGSEALSRLLDYPDIKTVLDIGSGTGVHANCMREHGKEVTTISMMKPANYVGDFLTWKSEKVDFDAIWACHVLEHQINPGEFLMECRRRLRPDGLLVVTVPPMKNRIVGGHVVLWNAGLLLYQLILAGFDCREARVGTYGYNISIIVRNGPATLAEVHCDEGDISRLAEWFPLPVTDGFDGRLADINWGPPEIRPPKHVVILGLGPSLEGYVDLVKRHGSRKRFADEVWAINAVADVIQCDRVFHMDDVKIQEARAAAKPESNIAAMVEWLKVHPGPVYTSRVYEDYPGLVAFPLQDIINDLGYPYFNNTCAYAVAYAIHLGVNRLSIFGCDFTYPNAHQAEKGRGCVEFWLGYARARGIEICVAGNSSLLDSIEPDETRLYGYDTLEVEIEAPDDGLAKVTFTAKELVPTAEQMEARYDHSKHPNPQVKGN